MSSDSDIECDTENEEQEDGASASAGFNQAFSVQSSSEGRSDRGAHLLLLPCWMLPEQRLLRVL